MTERDESVHYRAVEAVVVLTPEASSGCDGIPRQSRVTSADQADVESGILVYELARPIPNLSFGSLISGFKSVLIEFV